MMVFLVAGHETTSTALTFAVWLGHHLADQERVRQEIRVLGNHPMASDFDSLSFTTMVLKEALRLYPSAPILNRIAADDNTIDGYRVRRGQMVSVSPGVMHRRADLWPDPLKFDPLRFTQENEPIDIG